MNKEQASKAYIKGKLRDSREYLGCEENRRKRLITCDLYDLEQAFEDGWEESSKTMIDKACKWIKENFENYVGVDVSEYYIYDDEFADNFRKEMKKQL